MSDNRIRVVKEPLGSLKAQVPFLYMQIILVLLRKSGGWHTIPGHCYHENFTFVHEKLNRKAANIINHVVGFIPIYWEILTELKFVLCVSKINLLSTIYNLALLCYSQLLRMKHKYILGIFRTFINLACTLLLEAAMIQGSLCKLIMSMKYNPENTKWVLSKSEKKAK